MCSGIGLIVEGVMGGRSRTGARLSLALPDGLYHIPLFLCDGADEMVDMRYPISLKPATLRRSKSRAATVQAVVPLQDVRGTIQFGREVLW